MDCLRLEADLAHLEQIRSFVVEKAGSRPVPPGLEGKLELLLEEVVVNVANYAYPDSHGEIEVCCGYELSDGNSGPPTFVLTVTDSGLAYDPLARPDPDTTLGIDERPIGGLGVFFIKEMADESSYSREQGRNILTMRFCLPG